MSSKLGCLVLAASLLSFGPCFAQEVRATTPKEVLGTWRLRSIYKTANVQGPSPKEQNQLLNVRITYREASISACGETIPIREVEDRMVSKDDFLALNKIRLQDVRIKGSNVREITFNRRNSGSCLTAFPLLGQDIYLTGKDKIVVAFEGAFFAAVRIQQ